MAAVATRPPDQSYSFAAQPRPVQSNRQKYRDGPATVGPNNIMHDPRVVRGSTYAAQILPANAEPDPLELQRQAEGRRRRRLRKQQQDMQRPPRTPEPVEGRQHREIQTELYLEEITDRPVEVDVEVQTDQLLDRPPSPVFVPQKTGMDAETQVFETDLFDFDFEVESILEVIVGKTLEQSLMEVMEEEELENMRRHQVEFQYRRDAELAETQRMEEAERRRFEEKERRLQQERERVQHEKEAREKVAARAYAQHYLSDLMGSVFGSLNQTGFFYDTVERDIETGFMPWLMDRVEANLEKTKVSRHLADQLIANALAMRQTKFEAHQDWLEAEAKRLEEERIQREKEAEEERKRQEEEAARLAAEKAAAEAENGSDNDEEGGTGDSGDDESSG